MGTVLMGRRPGIQGVNLPRLPEVIGERATGLGVLPYYLLPGLICGVAGALCAFTLPSAWVCYAIVLRFLEFGFLQWIPDRGTTDGYRIVKILVRQGIRDKPARMACWVAACVLSAAALFVALLRFGAF